MKTASRFLPVISILSLSAPAFAGSGDILNPFAIFTNGLKNLRLEKHVADEALRNGDIRDLKKERFEFLSEFAGNGLETQKLQRFYDGVPVMGSMAFRQQDSFGNEEVFMNMPTFEVSGVPTIDKATALSIAQAYTRNGARSAPKLAIMPEDDRSSARLVYRIDFPSTPISTGAELLVDAHSGAVIANISKLQHAAPIEVYSAEAQGYVFMIKTKKNAITGKSVLDQCMLVDVKDGARQLLTAAKCEEMLTGADPTLANACQVLDSTGNIMSVIATKCQGLSKASVLLPGVTDVAANRAYTYAVGAMKYYADRFKRDSFDDNGSKISAVVHVGLGMDNAAWDHDRGTMLYGDGDGKMFSDFTADSDVAGHEMTHGVVNSSANLMFMGEPGALNEAFADFFGTMISGDADWAMGKKLFLDHSAKGLRDLADPASITTSWMNAAGKFEAKAFPAHLKDKLAVFGACNGMNDMCYVHGNATIPGHAMYLVHEAIGRDKTEMLAYTTLTQFLGEKANFTDMGGAFRKACGKLYDAATCASVDTALAKVGI